MGADRSLPCTQTPAEGEEREKQHTQTRCAVKGSVFSLWKRHNRSSCLCHSIPSAAPGRSVHPRSCSTAAQAVNSPWQSGAELSHACKTVGAFHMQSVRRRRGAAALSRKCSAAITPRETPRPCQVTILGKYVDKSQKTKPF